MPLHVLLAAIRHETNSFSPLPTPFEAFFPDGEPVAGPAVLAAHDGAKTAFGGLLEGARAAGAAMALPLFADALPSAPAAPETLDRLIALLLGGTDAPPDALLLDLHGAMTLDDGSDGEARILRAIRAHWPSVPIALALDFHANLAQEVVDLATIVCGYRTYPHVDAYETGLRAARLLFATINGELSPAQALCRVPVLPQMLRQVTDEEPMRSANALAQALTDGRDVVDVTVFGGFPLADSPVTGPSVLVVGGAGRAAAADAARRIAAVLWENRARLVDAGAEPVADTLARAAALPPPVIIADCGNNAGAGGTCDTMTVLAAMLAAGLRDIVAGVYWDPAAVAALQHARPDENATVTIGGRHRYADDPAGPLRLTGRVRRVTDGRFHALGPVYTGMLIELGTTIVFDTGAATLVVAERRVEGFDAGMFTHAGVDPATSRYVLVFSRVGYRTGFARYGESRLLVHGPGAAATAFDRLPYRHLPRPLYPLHEGPAPE
jgi:microcystin degradation protein MlrC